MRYRSMGRTGLQVSEICMGTMTWGAGADEEESAKMFRACLEKGVNFFDTANVYANTRSETILGKQLKEHRQELIVATKVFNPAGKAPNDVGLSRKHIMDACEASLKRLQTDYIDLYQSHGDDRWTPLEETLRAFDDLVSQGKVRYVGASNYGAWRLNEALWTSKTNGWAKYDCLQSLYNLVERGLDSEVLPLCRDKGVGVICWSPLASGWLTGKYAADRSEGGRLANLPTPASSGCGDREGTLKLVLETAKKLDRTPSQVALRWLLDQEGITSVIVGARTAAQLQDNLGAVETSLDKDAWKALDRVSRMPVVYPTMIDRMMTARRRAVVDAAEKRTGSGK